jgi:peptide/nickel transport system permease protein
MDTAPAIGAFLARRAVRALLTAALLLVVAGIVAGAPVGCSQGGCGTTPGPVAWVWGALRLDFGATAGHQPVAEAIGAALPATLLLVVPAALIILALGWGAGLALALAESNPGGWSLPRRLGLHIGRPLATAAGVAQVLPIFWLGGLLVAAVSVGAGWLPPGGIANPTGPAFGTAAYTDALGSQPLSILGDLCRHLLLPCCTLALAGLATAPRLLRAVLPAQWTTQHMRAARGAGLSGGRLVWRAVRPVLAPLLAGTAAEAPLLASALILVEYLYGWPGVGLLAYQATRAGDTQTMGALLLLFGLTVIAIGLLADALAALADPRLRGAAG